MGAQRGRQVVVGGGNGQAGWLCVSWIFWHCMSIGELGVGHREFGDVVSLVHVGG
jgi:hypothetical protein